MTIKKDDDDTLYCEWCGEFPYYISVYEDMNSSEETLLCKNCFELYEDD